MTERRIPASVRIYKPARAEERIINKRVKAKGLPRLTAGSRCDACPKILEESELDIRGYASGNPLGLCRKCASFVNTKEAIDSAEAGGHEVKAKPILVSEKGHNPIVSHEGTS